MGNGLYGRNQLITQKAEQTILNMVEDRSEDWAAILHFGSNLALVNLKHGGRNQVLSGAIQRTNHL